MSLLISQGVSTFIETITLDKWLTAEVPQGPSRRRPIAAIVIAATAAAWCPSPATDVSQWSTTHQAPAKPARRRLVSADTFIPTTVGLEQWLTETGTRRRPTKTATDLQGFVYSDVATYAWQTELQQRRTAKRTAISQDSWLPVTTTAVASVNLDQWLSQEQGLTRRAKPRPQIEDYANLLIAAAPTTHVCITGSSQASKTAGSASVAVVAGSSGSIKTGGSSQGITVSGGSGTIKTGGGGGNGTC